MSDSALQVARFSQREVSNMLALSCIIFWTSAFSRQCETVLNAMDL